jgi:hypothetical protein
MEEQDRLYRTNPENAQGLGSRVLEPAFCFRSILFDAVKEQESLVVALL